MIANYSNNAVRSIWQIYRGLIILGLFFPLNALAQTENSIVKDSLFNVSDEKIHFDMAFSIKSQNYFRGLLPSKAPTLATNAGLIWNNWIFAMYGGVGTDGVYQETDFTLIYYRPRFSAKLDYYYNFTQGITDIPTPTGLFDFDPSTTRGLLDFVLKAAIDKQKRWNVTSSVLIFGRDAKLEEQIIAGDTTLVRTDQRYSQYFELAYQWNKGPYKVEGIIGAAFSWADISGAHFYGSKPGLNNLGINLTRKFAINDNVEIPVKASALMNTLNETAYLLISINLIQLSKL